MGRLKLHHTGLQQPLAERMKIGDSWILKKDYNLFLASIHRKATRNLNAEVMAQARLDTAEIQTNWLYGAFALALHREFGWDADKIAQALRATDEVAGEIADLRIHDIWDLVSEETNVQMIGD